MDVSWLAVPGIQIEGAIKHANHLTIQAASYTPSALCPACQVRSHRIHSYYQRTPQDLPISGYRVRWELRIRRFRCLNEGCTRQTFTERLPAMIAHYAHQTHRLKGLLRQLGLAFGGEAAARASALTQVRVSPDSLLRWIRQVPVAAQPTPRVLGVDDWAIRKGRTYGTILVNLETHRVVDILPDSDARTFAQWLRLHPGVEVISRDRGGAYAEGARQGAPQALQVADRWHLVKNLWEALVLCCERYAPLLKTITFVKEPRQAPAQPQIEPPALPKAPPTRPLSPKKQLQAERRAHWEALLAQVHELSARGLSANAIAKQLTISRQTVMKYKGLTVLPPKASPKPGARVMDPYVGYIRQQLLAGETATDQLWAALQQQGFTGSRSSVYKCMVRLRHELNLPFPRHVPRTFLPKVTHLTARTAAAWIVCEWDKLTTTQQTVIEAVRNLHLDLASLIQLAGQFMQMIRKLDVAPLTEWMAAIDRLPHFPALQQFVRGLRKDEAAVRAGLSVHWSNGQTEGQVNRLKFIKRQMYGRANFDLLRLRVVC